MNAEQFKVELDTLRPTEDNLKSMGFVNQDVIKHIMNNYVILKKKGADSNWDDPIMNLISNNDVSQFEIKSISFRSQDDVLENEKYIFFGNYDSSLLAIDKATKEIVEVDWDNPDFIISYCAVSSDKFLDCLIYIESRWGFSANDIEVPEGLLHELTEIAGGDKYELFFKSILGIW